MLKILVPIDGSTHADAAIPQILKLRAGGAELDLHLLNVQFPIDGHARSFVNTEDLANYHREEGLAALANARRLLDEAGVPHRHHIVVGHIADTIVRYAQEQGFDKIIMGTHGRSGLLQLLLGSVASEVLQRSPVPVTLVRPTAQD